MQAEIITIGDEILIGQITDTNSAFIAGELNKIGVSVYQITSVQDDQEHILKALDEAEGRSHVVIMTGGLGPTKDDITKRTLCEYLNDHLEPNQEVLEHVEYLFKKYITTTPISDMNRAQANLPSKATVLRNPFGTAPGMWMQKNDTVFVSLPGVPYEMKHLMTEEVIPRIASGFNRPYIRHKTIITYGLGESAIAERIEAFETSLPSFLKLAYLPNLGKVRLRLSAKGPDPEPLEKAIATATEELKNLIGDIIYGEEEDETIEYGVAKLLTQMGKTLSTAESFTGGRIAEMITAIPGASSHFKGSIVCYATEIKIKLLGVPDSLIAEHSVVSEAVARAMAERAREVFGTDYAIATTGNAGPTKGDSDAEIGSVYIAIAGPDGVTAEKFSMGNHRIRIITKSAHKAFEMLQKEILKF
ncbi:competence/damage-inducible protein A [Zeaxanthinibacter sp. PT1]|uniref:competence/damage-inducible protein A n=1 Tax=Zeaxanthinibacter TaxID=561554 RepID=UPI00234B2307|nr:competence/damage-inducible protein A [Zeaxanthinibacter sp. PT1]MDC6351899.1 competence/damage-inducible protein A [Zeaxanthinibacter sp. PT1]